MVIRNGRIGQGYLSCGVKRAASADGNTVRGGAPPATLPKRLGGRGRRNGSLQSHCCQGLFLDQLRRNERFPHGQLLVATDGLNDARSPGDRQSGSDPVERSKYRAGCFPLCMSPLPALVAGGRPIRRKRLRRPPAPWRPTPSWLMMNAEQVRSAVPAQHCAGSRPHVPAGMNACADSQRHSGRNESPIPAKCRSFLRNPAIPPGSRFSTPTPYRSPTDTPGGPSPVRSPAELAQSIRGP